MLHEYHRFETDETTTKEEFDDILRTIRYLRDRRREEEAGTPLPPTSEEPPSIPPGTTPPVIPDPVDPPGVPPGTTPAVTPVLITAPGTWVKQPAFFHTKPLAQLPHDEEIPNVSEWDSAGVTRAKFGEWTAGVDRRANPAIPGTASLKIVKHRGHSAWRTMVKQTYDLVAKKRIVGDDGDDIGSRYGWDINWDCMNEFANPDPNVINEVTMTKMMELITPAKIIHGSGQFGQIDTEAKIQNQYPLYTAFAVFLEDDGAGGVFFKCAIGDDRDVTPTNRHSIPIGVPIRTYVTVRLSRDKTKGSIRYQMGDGEDAQVAEGAMATLGLAGGGGWLDVNYGNIYPGEMVIMYWGHELYVRSDGAASGEASGETTDEAVDETVDEVINETSDEAVVEVA